MIVLTGADLVLPDRVLPGASLVVEDGRMTAIEARAIDPRPEATRVDLTGTIVVPGFVDVHVHGVEGIDVLDGPGSVAAVALRLARYGVTAFCPTSIACSPGELEALLAEIRALRQRPPAGSAHVQPAHLESNFINLEYKGAQPAACLRPVPAIEPGREPHRRGDPARMTGANFTADDVMAVLAEYQPEVGIVTVAPELENGLALVRHLVAAGHRVSIGHTGASYEQSVAAIEAGVTHATHLFNRMTPMTHRAPGVPGAVLEADTVTAELICDGFHVHPTLLSLAIRVKGAGRIAAITDGTAGSGLPVGSRTRIGGRTIIVTERTAELEDGTLAGSVQTMDGVFRLLVQRVGASLVDAARMCATTPATQLGLTDRGQITLGRVADLTVLDAELRPLRTMIAGDWADPTATRGQ